MPFGEQSLDEQNFIQEHTESYLRSTAEVHAQRNPSACGPLGLSPSLPHLVRVCNYQAGCEAGTYRSNETD